MEGVTFDFKLAGREDSNYYIIFCSKEYLRLNASPINEYIYTFKELQESYIARSSNSMDFSFGIFLIPSTYNSLE